jgi:hypothetical protein
MYEKRKRLRFGLQFLLLIVAFAALVMGLMKLWQNEPRGPQELNFRLVKLGMHRNEVVGLLGDPAWIEGPPQKPTDVYVPLPCLFVRFDFANDHVVGIR